MSDNVSPTDLRETAALYRRLADAQFNLEIAAEMRACACELEAKAQTLD